MKVIGAGFGRTGTTSLHKALEIIGFGKSYHMITLFTHPDDISYWEAAASGKPVNWYQLFEGYNSVVDFPGSFYYKQLMEVYPEAKIILTVRDSDKWYESVSNTIYSFKPNFLTKVKLLITSPFIKKSRNLLRVVKMNKATIWQGLFQSNFEDRASAIRIFNNNIQDTIQYVPASRLLVFDVKEGWEPLCKFLNVPVPEIPFPKLNTQDSFAEITRNFLTLKSFL